MGLPIDPIHKKRGKRTNRAGFWHEQLAKSLFDPLGTSAAVTSPKELEQVIVRRGLSPPPVLDAKANHPPW